MATISLPASPGKTDETFSIERMDFALQMMNGGTALYTQPHYWWTYSFSLPPMTEAQARQWLARLNRLASFENDFTASPPGYSGPLSGYSGAAPKVKGGGQTGFDLDCDGVAASTLIAVEGDFISLNGELHTVGADATSDGSGNVTFVLCEPLRRAPADNADVALAVPVATFRLATAAFQWSVDSLMNFGLAVQAVERYEP